MSKVIRTEILAGISTFFTLAYLLILYPKILSQGGIDFGSALTATILTIFAATVFLALYADFPAVLAPGLSIGPFLVYSVILKQNASWQTALGIVFWAGLIIFLVSIFKIRQKILLHLPPSIKSAAIVGIGLFLICTALKNMGLPHSAILTLPNGITLFGLALLLTLHRLRIASAFFIAIVSSWVLAIFFDLAPWHGLAASPPSLSPTFFRMNLAAPLEFEWIGTLLSVVLICLFDTSAALTVLSKLAGKTGKKGEIEQMNRIVLPDGIGSMLGAVLGTGTLTFTLESSAGIKAGGRTKTTGITAAFCCLAGLFFYPLISSIPAFATTPAILAIGLFMTQEIRSIRWGHTAESIPAVMTLLTIPITLSIYLGFALGFISFCLLKALKGEWKEVHPVCWILAIIFSAHLSWGLATNHL